MFKIKKEDATLLFDVHRGLQSSREFIRGYPKMYLDVSKGVVKVDCAINPTIQFAFVGKNLVDMNGWFVIRSNNGDAVIITVSEDMQPLKPTPSQGRLPVRWMAIESLNYSVYTTKSDV